MRLSHPLTCGATKRTRWNIDFFEYRINTEKVALCGNLLLFQCLEMQNVDGDSGGKQQKENALPPHFGNAECAIEQCAPHHTHRYYFYS